MHRILGLDVSELAHAGGAVLPGRIVASAGVIHAGGLRLDLFLNALISAEANTLEDGSRVVIAGSRKYVLRHGAALGGAALGIVTFSEFVLAGGRYDLDVMEAKAPELN
jgi:hypothetical protein